MKHTAQQRVIKFEGAEPFALVPETAVDGERVAEEKRRKEADRAEAEGRQTELKDAKGGKYRVPEVKLSALRETQLDNPLLDALDKVAEFVREHVMASPRWTESVENFVVVLLNTRRKIIGFQVVSTGTLDTLLVHPREVFRAAVIANAHSIVMVHNHPSGDPTPSEADIKVTRDIIRAGQLLKIDVCDHVVIGDKTAGARGYVSLRELGYFYR